MRDKHNQIDITVNRRRSGWIQLERRLFARPAVGTEGTEGPDPFCRTEGTEGPDPFCRKRRKCVKNPYFGDGGTCPPFAAYVLREGIDWADCYVKFVQDDKKTD